MLAGERRLGGGGHGVKGSMEVLAFGFAMFYALGREIERIEYAAQTRVGRQRADERLGGNDLIREGLDVLFGQEQQSVLLEEAAALGNLDISEQRLFLLQRFSKLCGGILGLIRRLSVDDDHQKIHGLRECLLQRRLPLSPRELGIDQLVDIGVDAEALGREQAAQNGE